MTAQLVHDLKTFLTVIYCTGQMIQEESSCSTAKYYVHQILRSCESLDRLVEEILYLSQMEIGNLPLRVHSVHLVNELTNITQAYKLHAERKGLGLSLRFEGPVPRAVRTDGLRLQQIVANVIGNAIQFTEAGEVEIVCKYDRDFIELTINDTGLGISPAEQKTIFEPYRRLKSRAQFPESHGLGLPLARRLAVLLGGNVVLLKSKPGVGTTFVITIHAPPVSTRARKEEVVYAGVVKCT